MDYKLAKQLKDAGFPQENWERWREIGHIPKYEKEGKFELFKSECKRWIDELKLDNWEVHYRWEDDEENRASCSADLGGYIATLSLSTNWGVHRKVAIPDEEVKQCAKHEVIHLMLARISANAKSRYVSRDDLEESEEELVRKLEKIIK
ncbi:MAG: hypothetical protein HQ536_02180 [Parcubacteria group bacterium]|nr:hypothetical protein [Parcubacteria group bacterium]